MYKPGTYALFVYKGDPLFVYKGDSYSFMSSHPDLDTAQVAAKKICRQDLEVQFVRIVRLEELWRINKEPVLDGA